MPLLAEAYSDARLNLDSLDRDIKAARAKIAQFAEQAQAALKLDLDVDTTAAQRKLDEYAASVAQVKARIEADTAVLRAELDVDPEQAAALGREAREALEAGFGDRPLDLNVDLDYEAATFYGRVARASIEEGFGTAPLTVDVTADFDSALFAGRVARASIEEGFGVTALSVDVTVDTADLLRARTEVDGLTRFDEDIRLNLDTKQFDAAYAKVIAKLEALTRKPWNVDLDTNAEGVIDLIEEVIAAAKEADRLKVGIDFDFDAQAARDAANAARERVQDEATPTITPDFEFPDSVDPKVDVDTSRFDAKFAGIQGVIDRLNRETATLTFDANGADAVRDAARIREQIEALFVGVQTIAMRAEVQGDPEALARLADLEAQARRLDAVVIRLGVEERGTAATTGKLIALGRVADALDTNIEYQVGFSGRVNEQVIRRAAQQVADVQARVQSDIAGKARLQSVRDDAAAARERAEAAYRETVKAERRAAAEVLKIRRKTARAGLDLAARDDLKEAKQALAAAREKVKIARQEAADVLSAFRDADLELGRSRRATGVDERTERITVRVNGIAKAIAEFGLLKREQAGLDRNPRIKVESDGLIDMLDMTEQLRERSTKLYRDIGDKAADAARRVRESFRDRDFEFSGAGVKRELTSIVNAAKAAATKLRNTFKAGGQGGFDLSTLRRSFTTLWRNVTADASKAFSTVRKLGSRIADAFGEGATIRARVTGVAGVLADLAKIVAAKLIAGRDINIGVDVRGGLSRGFARITSGITGFLSTAIQGFGNLATKGGEVLGKIGSQVSGLFSQASGAVSDFVSNASKQVQSLASQLSAASGPIGAVASALGTAVLPAAIIAAITVLAGPIIAAVGGLIGAAIAFLVSSALAGVAAAGLPIAAILFDDKAKAALLDQVKPLKDELVNTFAPVTDLIVNRIAPAFVALARKVIPLGASIADAFIIPISDSLINLADALLPTIQQIAGPMAMGIASVFDTVAKFAPLFSNITLAVGPGLTNAFNAILEVSLRIGAIFASDIGAGFQAIADLLFRLEPALVSAGAAVLPIVNFVGELIALFVEAGAMFESNFQPIGQVFDQLTAALPQLQPVIAGIAVQVVGLVEGFIEILPVITALLRGLVAIQGAANVVVGAILRVVGLLIKGIGNGIDLLLSGIAGLLGVIADIPFLPDSWKSGLNDASDATQGFADSISTAVSGAGDLGQAALDTGVSMLTLGTGISMSTAATDAATDRIAELNSELRTGKVTVSDYLGQMEDLGATVAPAASKALENFSAKLDDGSIAGTTLTDTLSSLNEAIPDLASLLDEENTSIRAALQKRGEVVAAENAKLGVLLAVKQSGVVGAFETADLLEGLSPDQVRDFFAEFGNIGTKGFADAAARIAEQGRVSGFIIGNAVADANRNVALEMDKLKVVLALSDQNLPNLAQFVESQVDAADIPRVFAELSGKSEEELRNFNAILGEGQRQARELAVQEAERQASIAAEGARRAATAAAREARTAWENVWGENGLLADGNLLANTFAFGGGATPVKPGSDTEAAAAGQAFAESFGIGFSGEFATVKTEIIGQAINSSIGEVNTEPFVAAGRAVADSFTLGFSSALGSGGGIGAGGIFGPNGVGGQGAAGPVGALASRLTSNIEPFAAAGRTLAGALIVGAIDGVNTQSVGLTVAFQLLTAGLAGQTAPWQSAGVLLGGALIAGITLAVTTGTALVAGVAAVLGLQVGARIALGIGGALQPIVAIIPATILSATGAAAAAARAVGLVIGRVLALTAAATIVGPGGIAVRAAVLAVAASVAVALAVWAAQGRAAGLAFVQAALAALIGQAGAIIAAARAVGSSAGLAFVLGVLAATASLAGQLRANVVAALSGSAGSARAEGYGVGAAFALGLEAGIAAGLSRVRSTAIGIARSIAAAVKGELEIRSPSRVMERIGEQAVDGLALGMRNRRGLVTAIGSGIADSIPQQVVSRATQAQAVYNQATTNRSSTVDQSDRSVTFAPVIQTNDPYALYRKFEEIAKRRP